MHLLLSLSLSLFVESRFFLNGTSVVCARRREWKEIGASSSVTDFASVCLRVEARLAV